MKRSLWWLWLWYFKLSHDESNNKAHFTQQASQHKDWTQFKQLYSRDEWNQHQKALIVVFKPKYKIIL